MRFVEIDHYCDEFERRLQAGEPVSLEQFLQEHQLAADARLVAELEKLQREYRLGQGQVVPVNGVADNSPAVPGCATTDEFVSLEEVGSVIANYRLLQKIGEGGMGTVFLAEQQQPVRRKVALKIIKPGLEFVRELEQIRLADFLDLDPRLDPEGWLYHDLRNHHSPFASLKSAVLPEPFQSTNRRRRQNSTSACMMGLPPSA